MKLNCQIRQSSSSVDAKSYDTSRLRQEYLFENVMVSDEINMIYTMFERLVAGGAVPVKEELVLSAPEILKAEYFTQRRELGVINVGGTGIVIVGNDSYSIEHKEAIYIGRGNRNVIFRSVNSADPAKFYFCSAPAHRDTPVQKVSRADIIRIPLGTMEQSNDRTINKMMVKENIDSCQLQMGMTELKPGSTWNTMPPHTHNRRSEIYFYFDLPEDAAVCHFMGEPQETRHIWLHNQQIAISPEWSIHSACATSCYTFIWAMCGENDDYNDADWSSANELK